MTTFNKAQLDSIIGSNNARAKAVDALAKAQEKVQGAYSGTILVAVSMGAAEFDAGMDTLFSQIKKDGKLAKRVKAERTKNGKAWQVPGALRSARSVIASAFKFEIELLDEESAPRSFGAIRKDVKAANDAADAAKLSDNEIFRNDTATTVTELAEFISDLTDVDNAMVEHMETLGPILAAWKSAMIGLQGAESVDAAEVEATIAEAEAA